MKGKIFNIQKFSIHDGPGIRTTIFLKGCPLRCKWCANPESQLAATQILYDQQKCQHCQTCVKACPIQAIQMEADGRIVVNHARCNGCQACVKACPTHALTAEGEDKAIEEIVELCLQDEVFYEESGGGVTISGGEGMSQPAFAEMLVKKLKEHRIHTAIETTGAVGENVFQQLAPQFDLLLFDVKQADSAKHKEGTGVGNELIIKNLTWAVNQNLQILPRIPVIPGFNAELEDAENLARLLKQVGLNEVQLLPFHQMGERKYEFLNRPYVYKDVKALHPEDLQEYAAIFHKQGINAYF